ncbi:helix-hairpin-helix domain-containing protein [Clostridium botulinum]|uniref:ComEA family DNA-binding protein n=1 Tax=Clostridium botulinum TaxID=1491 RepID=UPI001A9397F0|nr:helix-hairpin-helix domain-containing protein [Clostridium botulinum]MBO0525271.1 helix-hairpin-helix domain-containing protein [Clostridium botulinum]MBO0527597.1 helix-hairpin-helix domain-containing protein [Clostridium botulinum]MBO0532192.1 helix-hairpin-helix domain-containing protein [Clostridium botulinum]MBO0535755.1 helix-hairpin-helix domain-containing protein [Clostridium botulinum]MBO0537295.1 helix-hairpin-helix domain-containing protein [Clostridium botulinum]
MAATQKGSKWEMKRSLWILCSFVVLVNGMGMYFAGKKTKVKRWYNYGLIYTAMSWVGLIMGGELTGFLESIGCIIFFLDYIICIVHSFKIRKEYLVRLEILEDKNVEQNEMNFIRSKIAKEYGLDDINSNNTIKGNTSQNYLVRERFNINVEAKTESFHMKNEEENINNISQVMPKVESAVNNMGNSINNEGLLDINSCSELELSRLPGMGLILAKKAANLRNSKNGFDSVDEFIEVVGVKPHFVDTVKTMICCKPIKTVETVKMSGRRVDF